VKTSVALRIVKIVF